MYGLWLQYSLKKYNNRHEISGVAHDGEILCRTGSDLVDMERKTVVRSALSFWKVFINLHNGPGRRYKRFHTTKIRIT